MTSPPAKLKKGNWGLVGHEWAVDMLQHHLKKDGVRHAYLFTGPPGLGRRTLALRFTQALNCPQPGETGMACGVCRDCRQVDAMQHPDLTIVQAETEGGTLKVEQVREIRRALALKPYQARYRVAIFLRFQEANDSASNALLKTLEEAPDHAVLILTADAPEQLLPTITSRCEILRLRPVSIETTRSFLISQGAVDDQAHLIAHVAGGRPGYALHLLKDESALEFRRERLDELSALLPASRVEKFRYAEKLALDKDRLRQVLMVWQSFWRDVTLRASQAKIPIANVDREHEIEVLATRLGLSIARQVMRDLDTALKRLARNVNPRLMTEVLLLDLPEV